MSDAIGGSPLGDFAARAVTGLVAGAAVAAARGGRVAIQQVATDAFGNVLGDSIAAANSSGDVLGDFIKKNDNWAGVSATPTFAEDRAARLGTMNPYGLQTSSAAQMLGDQGWAPTGSYGYAGSGDGITGWQPGPSTVQAGDYDGSVERFARAQLGPNASQREINSFVGQTIEINSIQNPRAVNGDSQWLVPGASTPAATSGLGVYGMDIALGEQMRAADRVRADQLGSQAGPAAAKGPLPAGWNMGEASAEVLAMQNRQTEFSYPPTHGPGAQLTPLGASTVEQVRMGVEKALVLPQIAAASAPTSLGYFAVGAIAGGATNYAVQSSIKPTVDWVDVGVASVTGGLTFGKGVVSSTAINSTGALIVATARGDDPTWKVAAAAGGTFLGAPVGNAASSFLRNSAVAAAIRYEAPALSYGLATSTLPMNAVASSAVSEGVGLGFDLWLQNRATK